MDDYRPRGYGTEIFGDDLKNDILSQVHNKLYDYYDNGYVLEWGLAKGCKCSSCREWQIIDPETNEIIESFDHFKDFIVQPKKVVTPPPPEPPEPPKWQTVREYYNDPMPDISNLLKGK